MKISVLKLSIHFPLNTHPDTTKLSLLSTNEKTQKLIETAATCHQLFITVFIFCCINFTVRTICCIRFHKLTGIPICFFLCIWIRFKADYLAVNVILIYKFLFKMQICVYYFFLKMHIVYPTPVSSSS